MTAQFLTAGENLPFAVALALLAGIALMEGIGLLAGMDLAGPLDEFLPDFDLSVDGEPASPLGASLDWLHLGKIPFLILLVIFLFAFGLSGFLIQYVWHRVFGAMLPAALASLPAFACALPFMRQAGKLVGRFLKEESTAVSRDAFVGKLATITLGRSTAGNPTQARLKDEHGQAHYVMVEPYDEADALENGETVILIERKGSVFHASRFEV